MNFYLVLLIFSAVASISATKIGVTYSTPASLPDSVQVQLSPGKIAEKFVSMKIPAVRLLDSNPAMIEAFAYTNVSLLLCIPNPLVPIFASNRSLAMRWLHFHVLPFRNRTKISTISVGNDVISYATEVSVSPLFLLPAMQNVHLSLADLRIFNVSVSTTFSFLDLIQTAQFQEYDREEIIKPVLNFLERTKSSFLVSLCPFNIYRSNCSVPIRLGQFEKLPSNFRDDLTMGDRFRKLFDRMLDAVFSSMAIMMGHHQNNVPVIVAETGWPMDSSVENGRGIYTEMLLKALVPANFGLRKYEASEVFMYEISSVHQSNLWGLNGTDKVKWGLEKVRDDSWDSYIDTSFLAICVIVLQCVIAFIVANYRGAIGIWIELRGLIRTSWQFRNRAGGYIERLKELDRISQEHLRQHEELCQEMIPFHKKWEKQLNGIKEMREIMGLMVRHTQEFSKTVSQTVIIDTISCLIRDQAIIRGQIRNGMDLYREAVLHLQKVMKDGEVHATTCENDLAVTMNSHRFLLKR